MKNILYFTAFLSCLILPNSAFANRCGAENQTPCKIWEARKSCKQGLVEDFILGKCVKPKNNAINQSAKGVKTAVEQITKDTQTTIQSTKKPMHCGQNNQKPCPITQFRQSCDQGLVEDFLLGRCVTKQRSKAHLEAQFSQTIKRLERLPNFSTKQINLLIHKSRELLPYLNEYIRQANNIARSIDRSNFDVMSFQQGTTPPSQRQALDNAVQQHLTTFKKSGQLFVPKSITIGVETGVSFAAEAGIELGYVIDVSPNRRYAHHRDNRFIGCALGGGIMAGAGLSGTIGFWNKAIPSLHGDSIKVLLDAQMGTVSLAFSKPSNQKGPVFEGIAIGVGIGRGVGLATVAWSGTEIYHESNQNFAQSFCPNKKVAKAILGDALKPISERIADIHFSKLSGY